MNYLLFYKGRYGRVMQGAEMRYAYLARELVDMGHHVRLCGRSGGEGVAVGVEFISVNNFFRLIQAFIRSDFIVLHGGGPFILAVALAVSFFGKRIVLDAYVPHWVELDALAERGKRLARVSNLLTSYFNSLRCLLGCLVFDKVLVANKRQLDLVRGFSSPFLLTRGYSKFSMLSYGCETAVAVSREDGRERLCNVTSRLVAQDDFLVGWLGGAYGWFDLQRVIALVVPAMEKNKKIKFLFFGVERHLQDVLKASIPSTISDSLIFLPWVDFSERLNLWAGLDLSIVWGGEGYENDYASRTRNFDCLALGLPIIQNYDDEWAPRLIDSGAGVIADELSLADKIYQLSISSDVMNSMRLAIRRLAPNFNWHQFTLNFLMLTNKPESSLLHRIVGLVGFFLVIPSALVFLVASIFEVFARDS